MRLAFAGMIDGDAIAPVGFRGVASDIGLTEQFRRGQRLRRDHRHADAGADVIEPAAPGEGDGADRLHNIARDELGPLHRAIPQDEREFVAAEARRHVAGPHRSPDDAADLAQQRIARRMADGVVDDLEAVEVDEAERVLAALADSAGAGGRKLGVEGRAVGKAGQRVVRRRMGKLALQLPRPRHVLEDQHGADHLAGCRPHRSRGFADVAPVAAAPDQDDGLVS